MSNMYRSRGCLNNSILNPLWADCCQSANASATEQSTQKYLRKTHAVSLKELQAWPKKVLTNQSSILSEHCFFPAVFFPYEGWEWLLNFVSSLLCLHCIVLIVWTILAFKLLTTKGWWFSRCWSPFHDPRKHKSCDVCWSTMFCFFTEIYSGFIFIFLTVKPKKQFKVFPRFVSISRSYNIALFQQ